MFEEDFKKMIALHGEKLFNLSAFAADPVNRAYVLSRKFLGRLYLESSWMEETLDSYGSRHNNSWAKFRATVAAAKLFSSVCYDVLHLEQAAPHYNLLSIQGDFVKEIAAVLDELRKSLTGITGELLLNAESNGIDYQRSFPGREEFTEIELEGKLQSDEAVRRIEKTDQTLVYLATSFLNLGEDVDVIADCVPDQISEEQLRLVTSRFHNLQSSYDTYLAKSDIEDRNPQIISLRGHVSIIYHLLKSATMLSHYYERHLREKHFQPLPVDRHLSIMFDFFIRFAAMYFAAAKNLCRIIISDYSEEARLSVRIPPYRGFHVRPSTLVAKIVLHYGGRVTMELAGHEYDAGSPLELFRVNETINAEKRRHINSLVCREALLGGLNALDRNEWPERIQLAILKLMDRGEIILYDQNLSLEGTAPDGEETPEEFFREIIALFLASGKIDINQDIDVIFQGDMRVLQDLKILAECGYGEDKFGNNILLPPQLSYLRH